MPIRDPVWPETAVSAASLAFKPLRLTLNQIYNLESNKVWIKCIIRGHNCLTVHCAVYIRVHIIDSVQYFSMVILTSNSIM